MTETSNLLDFCYGLFRGFIELSYTIIDFFSTKFSEFIDPALLPDALEELTILQAMFGASITVILTVGILKFFA